MIEIMKRN